MHLQVRTVKPNFRFYPMRGLEIFRNICRCGLIFVMFSFWTNSIRFGCLRISIFLEKQASIKLWAFNHITRPSDPQSSLRSPKSLRTSPLFSKKSLDHLISLGVHGFNEIRLSWIFFSTVLFKRLTKIFKNHCPKRRKNWTWVCWLPFHYNWQWRLLATKFES